ncbi:LysR family transcriptional regulator [Actinoplanes sp. NBRC 14428]|uniref:DNA-binding transcriptional LysR family regulator n=1 Tax=Pseudosporangium ferrugineum TaxID=439699 RepID=A0A2T0S9K6_9ACTN|nr:LysR substrate-binding domain-containing protein [Pseudosporangium ferrugineum]PRY30114.1 DNA-binding transcriptional LysR family regulator [Pseudosporangium ferrugineum]BCJ51091.1 LysR family transcriptional regulator [Actinoplanes sp. NBRC 14428]
MEVQLQQLRYFLAVVETRHFTQAADSLGVSQPTLSKQVHTLEQTLGAPLFERTRGAVALTAAGDTLLPLARRMIADADAARDAVQEIVGLRSGRVRVGATPSLCSSLVPAVLRRFRTEHPGIDLHVNEGSSQDLIADLLARDLDLALIVQPEQGVDPALHAAPVLRESLVVASVASGPPPTAGAELALTELRDTPLVMFRPGYDLRDVTLEACRRAGFAPRFAVEGGEMDAVLAFVEAGLGVALVPSMVLVNRPLLRATPLAPPGMRRTVALAHRRRAVLPHAAEALRATLLDHIATGELPIGVQPL